MNPNGCGGTCGATCQGHACIGIDGGPTDQLEGCTEVDRGEMSCEFGGADGTLCALDSSAELGLIDVLGGAFPFAAMASYGENFAYLYHLNNRDDLVRYADRGSYDATPIPSPTSCPSVSGFALCGGACGPCAAGTGACTGRSPMHPYGICVDNFEMVGSAAKLAQCSRAPSHEGACSFGKVSCFTFRVDPASQPIADEYGYVMSSGACAAAAAAYPGGADCSCPFQ